jgi:two-component system phosphate regulon sensor histidine kinase PhoR
MPLEERVSSEVLQKLIKKELEEYGIETKFEFGIYSGNLATNIKSKDFE